MPRVRNRILVTRGQKDGNVPVWFFDWVWCISLLILIICFAWAGSGLAQTHPFLPVTGEAVPSLWPGEQGKFITRTWLTDEREWRFVELGYVENCVPDLGVIRSRLAAAGWRNIRFNCSQPVVDDDLYFILSDGRQFEENEFTRLVASKGSWEVSVRIFSFPSDPLGYAAVFTRKQLLVAEKNCVPRDPPPLPGSKLCRAIWGEVRDLVRPVEELGERISKKDLVNVSPIVPIKGGLWETTVSRAALLAYCRRAWHHAGWQLYMELPDIILWTRGNEVACLGMAPEETVTEDKLKYAIIVRPVPDRLEWGP